MVNQGGNRKAEGGIEGRTSHESRVLVSPTPLRDTGHPFPRAKRIAVAVMLATLAGCATMSAPSLPEQAMPDGWKHGDTSQGTAETSWPDPSWWNNFGSPELVD